MSCIRAAARSRAGEKYSRRPLPAGCFMGALCAFAGHTKASPQPTAKADSVSKELKMDARAALSAGSIPTQRRLRVPGCARLMFARVTGAIPSCPAVHKWTGVQKI